MRNVGSGYVPYADERWSDARVVFEIVDTDAAEKAEVAASEGAEISRLPQTHDRIGEMSNKLASLELNSFILDDTFVLPNRDENGEVGWWSNAISGSQGLFAEAQVLEFSFNEDQDSVGFTVVFDDKTGECASDFTIKVYDAAGVVLAEETVSGNTMAEYVFDLPVLGYRKVRLSFEKTLLPQRRVRVCEVIFGIMERFTGDNMKELSILYELSPTMESLPMGEFSITIDNASRKYNLINPSGVYKYLQRGQELRAELGVGGQRGSLEYVDMGRFYFAGVSAEDSAMTARITAYDRIYLLDRGIYRRGKNDTGTVSEVVSDILSDSGYSFSILMPEDVSSRVIGWNVPLVTYREALRMVCQAARCCCFIDRDGNLVFRDIVRGTVRDTLSSNNLRSPAKVTIAEVVGAVEVNAVSFATSSKNVSEIYKDSVVVNGTKAVWVTYDASEITSYSCTGGSIDSAECFLYAARLVITASGEAVLTLNGRSLEEHQTLYRATDASGESEEGVVRVDNPLIRAASAQDFADWMLAVRQKRVKYALSERMNPAREIGDTVKIYDAYGENRDAVVVKEEYCFDGTLSGSSEAWEGRS